MQAFQIIVDKSEKKKSQMYRMLAKEKINNFYSKKVALVIDIKIRLYFKVQR